MEIDKLEPSRFYLVMINLEGYLPNVGYKIFLTKERRFYCREKGKFLPDSCIVSVREKIPLVGQQLRDRTITYNQKLLRDIKESNKEFKPKPKVYKIGKDGLVTFS